MNPTTPTSNDIQATAAHVADVVTDISANASEQAKRLVQGAASSVRDASDYVRDNGGELGAQIKRYLKANPSHALLGAAVVGFLFGRLMSRD